MCSYYTMYYNGTFLSTHIKLITQINYLYMQMYEFYVLCIF